MSQSGQPSERAISLAVAARQNVMRGCAAMLLATVLFALMHACVRVLSDAGLHPFEIAFFRCAFGLVLLAPWLIVHALVWGAAIGWFAFGELIDVWTWLGAVIIFSGSTYIAYRERQVERERKRAGAK